MVHRLRQSLYAWKRYGMIQFFEKRDPWGNGLALWVLLFMIFLSPLLFATLQYLELENDVTSWLPPDDPQAKVLNWYHGHFESEDRILVSWDGSSLHDHRVERFSRLLKGETGEDGVRRHGLPQVADVVAPHDLFRRMIDSNVEPQQALRRLQGVMIGTGALKVRLTPAGESRKASTMQSLVKRSRRELGIVLTVSEPASSNAALTTDLDDAVAESADQAPIPEDGELADALAAAWPLVVSADGRSLEMSADHHFQVNWRGMQVGAERTLQIRELARELRGPATKAAPEGALLVEDCFFVPGSPVALSVSLSEAGMADRYDTFVQIRRMAEKAGISPEALHIGGRPVAGTELNRSVSKAAWNRDFPFFQIHKRSVLLLSGLVGAVLALIMLRSVRLALLVLTASYFATLTAVALVPITGGTMNMVLVVMPTLLLVLTISGAIHVANYWKHAAHHDPSTAVVKAVQMARQPCILASLTTGIGLLSLMSSSLVPVSDFGKYAAIGCLVSLTAVLLILPSLLQFWPAKRPDWSEIDRREWKSLGQFLTKHSTAVVCLCLLAFGVGTYGLRWFRTETKVIRYFPEESRLVQDYYFLEENLAGIVPIDVIVRFDQDAQGELNFLQRLELVREVEEKMRAHPEISGTISLADFRPQSEPLPPGASTIQRLLHTRKAREIEKRVREGGEAGSGALFKVESRRSDLHTTGDGLLSRPGDELWRITAQAAVMTDLNYDQLAQELDGYARSVLRYHPGAGHVVTGMVPLFLRTQQAVLESLIRSFALAFAIIAGVIILVLKSPLAGLITMLPNLMPIGLVFGLISWWGLPVDIGTMITASVALGIAVDGTLHLLTWFRKGILDGLPRGEAVAHALSHCGPAMFQTSAIVGIGLLMLCPAELLLISRFGWLMAALIGAALLADVVFLPALLAGPLGRLIESTVAADPTQRTQPPARPPDPHLSASLSKARQARSLRVD
jgi:uncharacterized protein